MGVGGDEEESWSRFSGRRVSSSGEETHSLKQLPIAGWLEASVRKVGSSHILNNCVEYLPRLLDGKDCVINVVIDIVYGLLATSLLIMRHNRFTIAGWLEASVRKVGSSHTLNNWVEYLPRLLDEKDCVINVELEIVYDSIDLDGLLATSLLIMRHNRFTIAGWLEASGKKVGSSTLNNWWNTYQTYR
ncbi:hypothetical protein JTE90_007110 [Oedothorax gibbosus]|uniref:Uncharacterized protein n=1 Tax=Oedothorax gibbosus TaxID=931172 RepID=A0AAV6VTN1_9ARAC|nr:hypothetical protein JTE90_007110 [Oedothorax gibbosus]